MNVRVKGLIGSFTIDKWQGSFITLLDCTGNKLTVDQFKDAGGYSQSNVKYEYGYLKTHQRNVNKD